jgi:hypothetical protein
MMPPGDANKDGLSNSASLSCNVTKTEVEDSNTIYRYDSMLFGPIAVEKKKKKKKKRRKNDNSRHDETKEYLYAHLWEEF